MASHNTNIVCVATYRNHGSRIQNRDMASSQQARTAFWDAPLSISLGLRKLHATKNQAFLLNEELRHPFQIWRSFINMDFRDTRKINWQQPWEIVPNSHCFSQFHQMWWWYLARYQYQGTIDIYQLATWWYKSPQEVLLCNFQIHNQSKNSSRMPKYELQLNCLRQPCEVSTPSTAKVWIFQAHNL